MKDQTCPDCLITEALGAYCTRCFRSTEPSWIHPKMLSDAQRVARTRPRAVADTRSARGGREKAA